VLQTVEIEAQSIRLTFGAMDGEYFYFCEYAGNCYRVSSFLVATIVLADPDNYLSRAPADMGAASVISVVAEAGGGTLDARATYTEHVLENNQIETDADGNTVYDVTATANGETITQDAFDTLVQNLAGMTVSGKLAEGAQPSGDTLWRVTITTADGTARTLAAYRLDAFSDLLTVDGAALYYIDSEALRIALGDLYPGD